MLLVVPPEAPERAALMALERAASDTHIARPQQILAACDISTERPPSPGVRRRVPPTEGPALRLLPTLPEGHR